MESDNSIKCEKIVGEEKGERNEDNIIEKAKQLLNSTKALKEEDNKTKIMEKNEPSMKEENGSISDKEKNNNNKIEEEEKVPEYDIKGYEGDDDEYDFNFYTNETDILSTKARKGSNSFKAQIQNRYLFASNLDEIRENKIIFKEIYIIDLKDKLHSNVYRGKDKETNEELVFKFENIFHNNLMNEADILITLYNIERVPKIKTVDIYGYNRILAMNYIGPSLQNCLERCDGNFSLGTTLKVSIQVLDILKQIHDKGVVLRYLKPKNMVVGSGKNKNFVYLIDFDLARKVIIDGKHIQYGKVEHILGNRNFISINLHNYIEASRRDDVESLGYNLVYFMKGKFPWSGRDKEETKEKKMNISLEELCSGLPDEFKEFIEYSRKLEFSEKPDYEYLNSLLLRAAEKNNIDINSVKYDWEIKNEEMERIISEIKSKDDKYINKNDSNLQKELNNTNNEEKSDKSQNNVKEKKNNEIREDNKMKEENNKNGNKKENFIKKEEKKINFYKVFDFFKRIKIHLKISRRTRSPHGWW